MRKRKHRGAISELITLFIEYFIAALAEGVVAGIAWLIRQWRKEKRRQKKAQEQKQKDDAEAGKD